MSSTTLSFTALTLLGSALKSVIAEGPTPGAGKEAQGCMPGFSQGECVGIGLTAAAGFLMLAASVYCVKKVCQRRSATPRFSGLELSRSFLEGHETSPTNTDDGCDNA